jgi:hypothetical protein
VCGVLISAPGLWEAGPRNRTSHVPAQSGAWGLEIQWQLGALTLDIPPGYGVCSHGE